MTKRRELSMTDAAIRARDRRLMASINKQEEAWHAEIRKLMDGGRSFDDAWVAAGGIILDDIATVFHDQEREDDAA